MNKKDTLRRVFFTVSDIFSKVMEKSETVLAKGAQLSYNIKQTNGSIGFFTGSLYSEEGRGLRTDALRKRRNKRKRSPAERIPGRPRRVKAR